MLNYPSGSGLGKEWGVTHDRRTGPGKAICRYAHHPWARLSPYLLWAVCNSYSALWAVSKRQRVCTCTELKVAGDGRSEDLAF